MDAKVFRQTFLCGLGVLLTGALFVAGWAHADGAKFAQPERVALAMDNSPETVVAALEAILSQEQAAALEAALLPEPTDEQKRQALADVKLKLIHAGFAKDDPLVAAVATRADAIAVEADAAPEAGPAAQE